MAEVEEYSELVEIESRTAVANALVALAAARFWPHVRIEEMAKVVGLEVVEVQAAVVRWRQAMVRERVVRPAAEEPPRSAPRPSPTRSRPRPPGPPPRHDLVWCSWPADPHWVTRDEIGRNKGRKDGLSDWCLEHWRTYHRGRAEQRRNGRQPT